MKKIFVAILLMVMSGAASACDVCGCSLGGNYFGLLPSFDKNFVGLRWSQAKFYAYMNHQSDYLENEYSHDTYQKFEVWGRFKVGKRIQLFAFVPYSSNHMNGSIQKIKNSGLNDITLLAQYNVFKTTDEASVFQQYLLAGGGTKLPTGEFDLEDKGKLVNPNFQMGTGSVDFLINAMYHLNYKRAGFNAEAGYKMNTRNREEYRFGNQWYLSSNVLYSLNVGDFTFVPNTGAYYEQADHHQDGKVFVTNTGGHALFLSAGMETYFKKMSLGINHKTPISQRYNSDSIADIEAKGRWTISMTYAF